MIIDGREIGPGHPPYVIAEISCNHNGSMFNAMKLIEEAKHAGADAVKFQAYEADTITIDHDSPDFIIKDGPWKGRKLHELYSRAQTPFKWFPSLFMAARNIGVTPFASVFDRSSVDMLEKLDCPAYKIASMEITDIPLIEYASATGKPVILSTGMASYKEVGGALRPSLFQRGHYAVLACTSAYPAGLAESNLNKLRYFLEGYQCAGVSDHTVGHIIPACATAMGAHIIEKHLTLDYETPTEDSDFSMDPTSFKIMVRTIQKIWQAMQPKQTDVEESSRQLRRSLYIVKDMKKGEPFTEENVRSIRPAYGMEPAKLPLVLSKVAARDLARGTALKQEHLAEKTKWDEMWSTPFCDSNPDFRT